MQEEWGFINTGFQNAAVNMALDECLLQWHSKNLIPPTLRFYGWDKPSLSIGRFQNLEKTIDLDAVKKYDCQYVRRMTGGSAVLHDDELTYSIIISEDHPQIPRSIREAYYILSKGVIEGYRFLNIDADYYIPKERNKNKTAVCFEKIAYYEMIVDGKKISGNAQTRKNGVLLQHGSIPMSMDDEVLFELFKFSNDRVRERQRKSFKNKAIAINDITGKKHTYDMLAEAFLEGFKKGLNITVKPIELTKEQWQEVYQLAEDKYANELTKNKLLI